MTLATKTSAGNRVCCRDGKVALSFAPQVSMKIIYLKCRKAGWSVLDSVRSEQLERWEEETGCDARGRSGPLGQWSGLWGDGVEKLDCLEHVVKCKESREIQQE